MYKQHVDMKVDRQNATQNVLTLPVTSLPPRNATTPEFGRVKKVVGMRGVGGMDIVAPVVREGGEFIVVKDDDAGDRIGPLLLLSGSSATARRIR